MIFGGCCFVLEFMDVIGKCRIIIAKQCLSLVWQFTVFNFAILINFAY